MTGRSHYVLYSRPPVLDSVTPTVSSCYLDPLLEHAFFLGLHICPPPAPLQLSCFSWRGEPTLGSQQCLYSLPTEDPPCWGPLISSTHSVSLAWSCHIPLVSTEPCPVWSYLKWKLALLLFFSNLDVYFSWEILKVFAWE